MKNIERQTSLDKSKWLLSEQEGKDMSGRMWYCKSCGMQGFEHDGKELVNVCLAKQRDREADCICAKAYNRAKRSLK